MNFNPEIFHCLEPLSDRQFGKMIRCIQKYDEYVVEPAPEDELSRSERALFAFAKNCLDKRQEERIIRPYRSA
jgi:hypothetical protein